MMRPSHNRAYMTPNEVAELLMVSPVTVRQWAQKGVLKAVTTPGGHRRFLGEDVEAFAKERGMQLRSNSPLRVLVVDDNHTFAQYLVDLLATVSKPIVALAAHDGFDAGRKVQQFAPDIVLLDLKMPGLDGFTVCQQIKDDPTTQHIRVIAMTGYFTPENELKIRQAGAEACLSKPFDKKVLFKIMGLELSGRGIAAEQGADQHAM
jgi:excisionase family DNA binding protein